SASPHRERRADPRARGRGWRGSGDTASQGVPSMLRNAFPRLSAMRAPAILLLSLGVTSLMAIGQAGAQDKHPFVVSGTFVEACSCSPPCACELVDLVRGCEGVGAVSIVSGSYGGSDLSGARIAYATAPGDWVRLYVDAKNPRQREAAEKFARAAFA